MLRPNRAAEDVVPRAAHGRRLGSRPERRQSMQTPSPLAVLSGALKIADKFTIAMEAVGNPEKKGVTLAKARGE